MKRVFILFFISTFVLHLNAYSYVLRIWNSVPISNAVIAAKFECQDDGTTQEHLVMHQCGYYEFHNAHDMPYVGRYNSDQTRLENGGWWMDRVIPNLSDVVARVVILDSAHIKGDYCELSQTEPDSDLNVHVVWKNDSVQCERF